MGPLIKDVPSTRYNLLDRLREDSSGQKPLRHRYRDIKNIQSQQVSSSHDPLTPLPRYQFTSTLAELEAYIRQAYGQ